MTIDTNEKLTLIRESERLKKVEMSKLVGIPYSSLVNYEAGRMKMSLEVAAKILKHERFKKYRDWFMFDETDPSINQIAPVLAKVARSSTDSNDPPQKTG